MKMVVHLVVEYSRWCSYRKAHEFPHGTLSFGLVDLAVHESSVLFFLRAYYETRRKAPCFAVEFLGGTVIPHERTCDNSMSFYVT